MRSTLARRPRQRMAGPPERSMSAVAVIGLVIAAMRYFMSIAKPDDSGAAESSACREYAEDGYVCGGEGSICPVESAGRCS